MKLTDSAVLYCSDSYKDYRSEWIPYLLRGVKFEGSDVSGSMADSVMYIFYTRTNVLDSGGEPVELPEILPGYLVSCGDNICDDPASCSNSMRVTKVEKFRHGNKALWHLRVFLK